MQTGLGGGGGGGGGGDYSSACVFNDTEQVTFSRYFACGKRDDIILYHNNICMTSVLLPTIDMHHLDSSKLLDLNCSYP